jgi:zinc transporter ZupT
MTGQPIPTSGFTPRTALLFLVPIILLAGVIALFLSTGGGLALTSPAPVEHLNVERYLLDRDAIRLQVRNTGPQAFTVAQVIVNEAVMPFEVQPGAVIPRLARATIHIPYHWTYGEAYGITVFSGNAIAFSVDIPVAFETPQPSPRTFLGFTLIGLYVGVIPVFLGIFWYPALRTLGRKWMVFLMAITAGLLLFLGLDTVAEAFEQAAALPGVFQGIGLIGIGSVGTFLILDAISRRQMQTERDEAAKRERLAFMIATGIGIHNLGEGLAIGAAYNIGEISLGTFLVVGFIIQNITEGLGIVAPVLRDRPGLRTLALMGLIGGGPAILGAWIGGYSPSPLLSLLFFAIGTGAIFEVVVEIARLIRSDLQRESMPMVVVGGVLAGMLLLWVTGLMIK